MAEMLETAMLVCFGCSWPMNLIKNIKAKTAKSMSLKFIALIIIGYIAGITAKIINHRFNYVLVVYLLNLVVVMMNLAVYFINRKYDKVLDQKENQQANAKEQIMKKIQARELTDIEKKYCQMNKLTNPDGAVFFGSNYFSQLPFGEFSKMFQLDEDVYNRSVSDTKISQLCEMLEACVVDLAPRKVFVNIGDYDISCDDFSYEDFIAKYEWLLYGINTLSKADIYVVSILSSNPLAKTVNDGLKALADEYGCRFIDISETLGLPNQDVKAFNILKVFVRNHPMSFDKAMNTINV